ncbi:hypothetical protein GCM10023201_36810 [Actinomycetospora corticicola]|uniref:Uncharacterized protein n=1 Tax=Actinomycetospora corticicola TaxID=663602 RepID=A0A7Y9DZ92_9PSEU|nr:hypothetical protein [Actinomycetospora corticicola]NYD38216.1 hypothetical protein [Actinomycetospora corticicola]
MWQEYAVRVQTDAVVDLVHDDVIDTLRRRVDVSTEAEFERELNTPPPPSGAAFAALKEMRAGSPGDSVTVDAVWDALTDAGVVAQRPGRVG